MLSNISSVTWPSGRLVLGIAVVLTMSARLVAAPEQLIEVDRPTDEVIGAYLEDRVADSAVPGLAVVVTQGSEVLHVGGYGSAGGWRPMTAHTPMRIASLSKSFTAVAVLQLVADGRVDLDASARRYLPGFTLAEDEAAGRITVRHLLNQTSGLADRGFPELWQIDQHRPAERVAQLATARPIDEPGESHHYFNPNYEILAAIVEGVTGEPFGEYLERAVLAPLGMTDTVSINRAEHAPLLRPALAQGHVLVFGRPIARAEPAGFVAGSAGIVTTANDLARWLRMHLGGGTLGGTRVLTEQGVELLQRPPETRNSDYAMGWWRASRGGMAVVEHNGVLATSYAHAVLVPETGYGIALLANASHAAIDVPDIATGLIALLDGREAPSTPVPHRRLSQLIALGIAFGIVVRLRQLLRRDIWAHRASDGSWPVGLDSWRPHLGVGRLMLPVLLLALLPRLLLLGTGRAFPHRLLLMAAPELAVWLVVASVTGLALAFGRLRALAGDGSVAT